MEKKRPATVAFLMDMLYEDYAIEAWKWAIETSRETGTAIIAFAGGNLKPEEAENRQRNDVYGLVGPESSDAIVSLSASLANTVGTAGLLEFFERFRPLPVIHIGIEAEGIAFFRAEGYSSTKGLVLHLIDDHAKRAIAFISGPSEVMDADERFSGYRDALAERGIEFDPGLVYRGDFRREEGERAVKALLDERGKTFDAVVSANDFMATFAIRELAARGLRVPDDVAVVGYDDISIARDCAPPLTTVRQPIREMMRQSFREAALVAAGAAPLEARGAVLPSEFVRRRSCGCSSALSIVEEAALGGCAEDERGDLPSKPDFDAAWKAIEEAGSGDKPFPEVFAKVESALLVRRSFGPDAARILALLVQAETERRTARERQLREDDALMRRITGELLGSASSERLGRALERVFERAGLRYYLVAEYIEGGAKARALTCSRGEWEGTAFEPRRLGPGPAGVASLVVLPLYIGDESLGFFVTDGMPGKPALLELIREHLSSAIVAARNEARERSRAAELERLVAERTAELAKAFNEAQEAKDKVERISLTDELTGLLNRRGFMGAGERELRLRGRDGRDVAVVFADVDGLKSVNDNFGHDEGDWVIRAMARIIREGFRSTDLAARLGGDEFTVLAVDCGPEDLAALRERLRARTEILNDSSGKPYRLDFSLGVAFGSESEEPVLEELMKAADMRLYHEKQDKRSRGARA